MSLDLFRLNHAESREDRERERERAVTTIAFNLKRFCHFVRFSHIDDDGSIIWSRHARNESKFGTIGRENGTQKGSYVSKIIVRPNQDLWAAISIGFLENSTSHLSYSWIYTLPFSPTQYFMVWNFVEV